MSKRIHVTLPDKTYERISAWAKQETRPVANLVAYLVEKAVEEAQIPSASSVEESRN